MSALALPEDVAVLDAVDDPGAFVVAALDRAKAWLAQATTTDLPEVVENKRRAEAIRCYVAQKELAHDAELAATELVRRAERRIEELVKVGQAEGEILKRGQRPVPGDTRNSPRDFLGEFHGSNGDGAYALAGADDDAFEEALDEAREEKNMSRANVVRKVRAKTNQSEDRAERIAQVRTLAAQGHDSRQIAKKIGVSDSTVRSYAREAGIALPDDFLGNVRRHDSNRIARESVATIDGVAMGLGLIEYAELNPAEIEGWVTSLNASMTALNRFKNKLKEMTRG